MGLSYLPCCCDNVTPAKATHGRGGFGLAHSSRRWCNRRETKVVAGHMASTTRKQRDGGRLPHIFLPSFPCTVQDPSQGTLPPTVGVGGSSHPNNPSRFAPKGIPRGSSPVSQATLTGNAPVSQERNLAGTECELDWTGLQRLRGQRSLYI